MTSSWLLDAGVVFGTILGLEIVDRTNMTVIRLASLHSPRAVWTGAALAYVVSTLITVLAGQVIVLYLSPYLIDIRVMGGVGIVGYGAYALFKSYREDEEVAPALREGTMFLSTFAVILALEMGDDTQIFTILFMVWVGNLLLVLVAALLGFFGALSVGVGVGRWAKGKFHPQRIERVTSGLIMVVGAATIALALFPP
jgi:putative Ca2+/H+ antiporter (TMEM165/GDT1 family)